MLFLQPWFWIFAAVIIPGYWLCPQALKLHWLLLGSIAFQYHFAGPAGMAPIIILAALTYLAGLRMASGGKGRAFTVMSVLLVGALAFYKYAGFLLSTGSSVLGQAAIRAPTWMTDWHTPAAPLAKPPVGSMAPIDWARLPWPSCFSSGAARGLPPPSTHSMSTGPTCRPPKHRPPWRGSRSCLGHKMSTGRSRSPAHFKN
jgi:hypothetical protein